MSENSKNFPEAKAIPFPDSPPNNPKQQYSAHYHIIYPGGWN